MLPRSGGRTLSPRRRWAVSRRLVTAVVGMVAAGLVASAAYAATSPLGFWKRTGTTYEYKWVALGGGTLGEVSLTPHTTQTNRCPVPADTLVYRYHPLGGGLYREDEFTWESGCSTHWTPGRETVKIVATATRLEIFCDKPYTRVCWSYTRIDRTAPTVQALASTGTVGGRTVLRYRVGDDSGKSWEALTIYRDGAVARRYRTPLGPAKAGRLYGYILRATPASFRGRFRFCVQSHDAAGNVSKPSCATVTIR